MLAYLIRRLAYGVLTVQGVLLLLFVLFFLYATQIGRASCRERVCQYV